MSILTYIIGLPLLAAIVLAFVPRNFAVVMRFVAVATTLISALLAIVMFARFQTNTPGYQFEQQIDWVQSLGISYHVGVDGINVGLVLMGSFFLMLLVRISSEALKCRRHASNMIVAALKCDATR